MKALDVLRALRPEGLQAYVSSLSLQLHAGLEILGLKLEEGVQAVNLDEPFRFVSLEQASLLFNLLGSSQNFGLDALQFLALLSCLLSC